MTAADAMAVAAAAPVAGYIALNRAVLAPFGAPLAMELRQALAGYFPAADLDQALVAQLAHIPAVRGVAAITFGNVIAARVPLDAVLAFHELVHSVQYRLLGVVEFARLYARGYFASGSYWGIPLEQCAYGLEARFSAGGARFDVEAEVARWIREDRF